MTVRAIGKILAGELHQLLKPLGFSKQESTFSRNRIGYVELFHLAGSGWNSSQEPWEFYVEVAIRFDDIPTNTSAKGLWRKSHAVGRVSDVVALAPQGFSVTAGTIDSTAKKLARLIGKASTALPDLLAGIKPRAEKGLISPLPLPESWDE